MVKWNEYQHQHMTPSHPSHPFLLPPYSPAFSSPPRAPPSTLLAPDCLIHPDGLLGLTPPLTGRRAFLDFIAQERAAYKTVSEQQARGRWVVIQCA